MATAGECFGGADVTGRSTRNSVGYPGADCSFLVSVAVMVAVVVGLLSGLFDNGRLGSSDISHASRGLQFVAGGPTTCCSSLPNK